MLDKVKRLIGVIESVQGGHRLDDDVARWLIDGLQEKMKTGKSLDTILGTSNLQAEYCRLRRNRHLLNAWKALAREHPEWSDYRCSLELARIARNFEAGRWRNIEFDKTPPDNLPIVQKALFGALKTGMRVPSGRQIYNIVKLDAPF